MPITNTQQKNNTPSIGFCAATERELSCPQLKYVQQKTENLAEMKTQYCHVFIMQLKYALITIIPNNMIEWKTVLLLL